MVDVQNAVHITLRDQTYFLHMAENVLTPMKNVTV